MTSTSKKKLKSDSACGSEGSAAWESATPASESQDGAKQKEWIRATIEEWRHRPEPHRSDALRELMQTIKVQDGETMEYVTLFAWAGFQKQSQHIRAIRHLVAARCVQEKISEAKYKSDVLPQYKVTPCECVCVRVKSHPYT